MVDREKVIKGLELCTENGSFLECISKECPFIGGGTDGNCIEMLMRDALTLLKAQEPVLVKHYTEVEYGFKPKVKVGECPICGRILNEQAHNFCSKCGQAVKWDG